ncbi:MAG: hypothetical protein JRI68_30460 [Deltaproteobacteria bacterium]|nr:hypothetical protein [Deltaproteobacteria bacterium]
MTTIHELREYMMTRRCVLLDDGRTGIIVRLDTDCPDFRTTVSLRTSKGREPDLAKVDMNRIVGLAPEQAVA